MRPGIATLSLLDRQTVLLVVPGTTAQNSSYQK